MRVTPAEFAFLTREKGKPAAKAVRNPRQRHGDTTGVWTKEYRAWAGMVTRCHNPNGTGYQRYGGRGVSVCDRWRNSYSDFLEDIGRAPSPAHSLDRIDNDGDYEPSNVRWATRKEQANNCSVNARIEINGETLTMAQWAERSGLPYSCIRSRRRGGVTGAALLLPVGSGVLVERAHLRASTKPRDRVTCAACGWFGRRTGPAYLPCGSCGSSDLVKNQRLRAFYGRRK